MRNLYNGQNLARNVARYQSALPYNPLVSQVGLQGPSPLSLVDEATAFVDKAQAKADKLEKAMTWLTIAAGVNMGIGLVLLWKSK